MKSAAELIMDSAICHRLERFERHAVCALALGRVGRSRCEIEKKFQPHGQGKFRRALKATGFPVEGQKGSSNMAV